MTSIDEAIEKHKKLKISAERNNDKRGAFYSDEEHKQIAEWLEELKELRKIKEDYSKGMQTSYATFMYNNAIDDFLEAIDRADREEPLILDMYEIEQIAEHLKGGVENE